MSSNTPLTNEQKLDEIYHIIKASERHRLQASVARIAKWVIILSIVGFVVSNPDVVIKKMTEIIQPIVMDQVKTMMESNQDSIMNSLKDMLPTPRE